ncbi:hypothetical protein [Streptomyces hilarionis]|uniref:hypothetical protein n=1 Tax=Streptomyces hilarionis TaxID=2839954 RepID=UPI00211A26C4|nr:hypothetical protein [Streptomyces hilarionis]MCQ9131152.1 hypothetical protein [Streptomyces hilarionis]
MDLDKYSVFFATGSVLNRVDFGPDGERWHPTVSWPDVYPELAFGHSGASLLAGKQVFQVSDDVIAVGGLNRLFDLRRGRRVPTLGPGHTEKMIREWMRGAGMTVAAGPTVLTFQPIFGGPFMTVHVPTRTVSQAPHVSVIPQSDEPAVLLPDPVQPESDQRTLYVFPSARDTDDFGTVRVHREPFTNALDFTREPAVDHFRGLADVDGVVDCAWLVYGRFDVPPRTRFTRELPDEFFLFMAEIAGDLGLRPWDLAAIGEVESGLRLDAYHPAGRYGFLGLSGDDLEHGEDPPHALFALSAHDQLNVTRSHLSDRGVRDTASEAHTWAGLLVSDFDVRGASPDTVLAGAEDAPELRNHLAPFASPDSGVVTLGDLAVALQRVMTGERWEEIGRRLRGEPLP